MSNAARALRLGLVLLLALAWARPQAGQDLDKELARVRDQVLELRERLADEEKKETTLLSSLDRIMLHKSILRSEISLYGLQIEKTTAEQRSLKKSIPPLEAKRDRERRAITQTLVTLYKFGRFSSVQFFFQAEDMRSLASESRNLSLLAKYQQDVIGRYQATLSQLDQAQLSLEAKKKELVQLQAAAKGKRAELESEESRNKKLIATIRQNRESFQQALEELRERERQLQQLMDRLVKQEIVLPMPFVPFYQKKGKLPWPLEGKVITRFGEEKHPQFNTKTMNNGIEIAPDKENAVIKAVHGGKVVYADYFQGYGNLLIIDHGLSYYSLYGHCADFLVKKGDLVASEQAISIVGDVGSLKGVNLYLEIRLKAKPLNPLQWLARR